MPVPPTTPKISIPNPLTKQFYSIWWIIHDIENVFLWLFSWILYGISLAVDSIFQAFAWLVTSVFTYIFNATQGLGPLSAPLFLVLVVGAFAILLLVFDQIVSMIPK